MSMDLSKLTGEQLLMMSIMGVLDQETADNELDRRALLDSPGIEETIASLLQESVTSGPKRKRFGNAA